MKLDTPPAAAQPKHDPGLKVMYKLREDVPVKPVLGFVQTCHEVAKEAPAIFAQELTNALRTAR